MEMIPHNPLLKLENDCLRKEFRRVNQRTKTISTDQFYEMVKDFPQWIRRPCICAWCAGMRQGEVISLKWQSVDLVERLIRIQASGTKETDNKTIGIEQELFDVLIEIQTERGGCKPDASQMILFSFHP